MIFKLDFVLFKDSLNHSRKFKNESHSQQQSQPEGIRESGNWNAQSRATAAFGSPPPPPDPYQPHPQSSLHISNSSKAESQRRTIENIDNDFSRENKFAAVEETSPLELPQMTESSVMRPSALPDEEDGILSREIFAALESFQKLTQNQPGFQAKLEQKLASKSEKEKALNPSANSSRKSSVPNWRMKKGESKNQTSTDSLPSMSKHSVVTGGLSAINLKKPKVLPPKEPTKASDILRKPLSSNRPAITDLLSYKSNVEALSDTHEERSVAKDKGRKSFEESGKLTSGSASKKGTSGLVRVDSTGGRANKGPAANQSQPSSLLISQSGADLSEQQPAPKQEPGNRRTNNGLLSSKPTLAGRHSARSLGGRDTKSTLFKTDQYFQ